MLRQLTTHAYFSCIIEDSYTYSSWAWQFVEALKEGITYPRWMPLNFWGYGGPTFILYPPLAFYLVGLFNFFTHSIIMAMNITKFAAYFLGAVGMYFLVREFYSQKTALLTSLFYIVFPYHVFQFYLVGTFASTVSFMWFPPILLFIHRYCTNRKFTDLLLSGSFYGGLILTHLINAYMFSFVIAAFIMYLSVARRRPKDLMAVPFILLIGISMSAAYILPAFYEKNLLNLQYFVGVGSDIYFKFYNFFILPNMSGKLSHGHLWLTYYSTFVFFLLFFAVLMLLFLLQIIKSRHDESLKSSNTISIFFFGATAVTIFLLFGVSRFVWGAIPFFDYIQFPTRWLSISSLMIVFLSSLMFRAFTSYHKKRGYNLFIILLFVVCLVLDYKYISSAFIFDQQKLMPVKAANWNLEHMPVSVSIGKIDMNASHEKVIITRGEGTAEVVKWASEERIVMTRASQSTVLKIRTFYFPGWKAFVDGVPTGIGVTGGESSMELYVPAGIHKIAMRFTDTPVRFYSKIISLTSFTVIAFGLFFSHLKKSRQKF